MNGKSARQPTSRRRLWRSARRALVGVLLLTVASASSDAQEEGSLAIRFGRIDPPIVAQRDITVRSVTSIHPLDPDPKPLECSGLASVGGRLLLTSDRHSHVLFTMDLDVGGSSIEIGLPREQQVILTERHLLEDAECVTAREVSDGLWEAIVFCSMSNDPAGDRRAKRSHIARMLINSDGVILDSSVRVIAGDLIRDQIAEHFDALNVSEYRSFDSSRGVNTNRWGNIEGAAWTPHDDVMLCGLRTPLANDDAILVALAGLNSAFTTERPEDVRVIDLFRLNLGGRGVTDLAWDPLTGGYLITAALSNGPKLSADQIYPLENLRSALFWWSGEKSESPIEIAQFPDLNIEAVARVEGTRLLALGSDEGDVSEERRGRQSVITLMYFAGANDG